jgi:hypothetical protein
MKDRAIVMMARNVLLTAWKILVAEFYAELVPRWLKRPVPDNQVTDPDTVKMISTILKLPAALVLAFHPVPDAFQLNPVSIYLAIDFLYQYIDISDCAARRILPRSATFSVDLLSYLFWFGWHRAPTVARD